MKFTRGPWHVNAVLKNRVVGDETATQFDKLEIYNANCNVALVNRACDARLIASAPSLYEALRGMLEAYAPGADETAAQNGEKSLHSAVREARSILRRIEGAS